jgi:Bacterial conjugation TrbI-like protein
MAILPPWSQFKQVVFKSPAAISVWILVLAIAGAYIYSRFFIQPRQEAKRLDPAMVARGPSAEPTQPEEVLTRSVAPMRGQQSPRAGERVIIENAAPSGSPAPTPTPLGPESLNVIDGSPQPEATPPPPPGTPQPTPQLTASEMAVRQLSQKEPLRLFSDRTAPFGRLIKGKLVVTVDSSSAATPIIGLTTEDVWWNGEKIIPINSEIHGTSQPDVIRDRIPANNQFVIVIHGDGYYPNGTEFVVQGKILDRDDADADQNIWGITDGSYGMKGEIVQAASDKEIQLFLATFLSTGAQALQTTQTNGFSGTTTVQPTVQNALLAGTSGVLNQYADQMLAYIKKNAEFVRVAAGHPFYLYVTETIDAEDNRVGASQSVAFRNKRATEDRETDQSLRRTLPQQTEEDPLSAAIRANNIMRARSEGYPMLAPPQGYLPGQNPSTGISVTGTTGVPIQYRSDLNPPPYTQPLPTPTP